jgi:hypothetical protein
MMDYGLVLLYLSLGLGLIVALSKGREVATFFTLLVYSLTCATTLASIFQCLYLSHVLILTLTILLGMVFGLKIGSLDLTCGDRWGLLLCVLYLSFFSFQFLEGFLGGQDGRSAYLPMSRLLSQRHAFPTSWYDEALPNFSPYVGYPPALMTITSLLFHLTGTTTEELTALVPAVFFIGFLIILLQWCKEEEVSLTIPVSLLLLSPLFIEKFSWFGFEAPLVFGTTLLAYSLWKFSRGSNDQYLLFAMVGSSIALMSKYTGFFFTVLLIFCILKWKGFDKKVWGILLLIHLTPALWYLRNIYYYGNPVPPFLTFLTIDPQFRTGSEGYWLLGHEEAHIAHHKRLINLALNSSSIPFLFLWASIFPFAAKRKELVYLGLYVLFCVFLLFWLTFSPDVRYIMPFYGVAIVHLSLLTQEALRQRTPNLHNWMLINSVAILLTLLFSNLCVQYVYVRHIFPDHISPILGAMKFLVEEEGAKPGTKIFTDTDHILAWQAKWVVFDPATLGLTADFQKAREQKDLYGLMRKYRIQYVINHPWQCPWEEGAFDLIERDNQHFIEIYRDTNNVTVWKVVAYK